MKKFFLLAFWAFLFGYAHSQTNIVSYAGGTGKETFYDVMQITDGTFLVCGYAQDLNWINTSVPRTQLTYTGSIPNSLGTNQYGMILHLSADLKTILHVVHFPQGAVEDIRFMKTNSLPYTPTGDLYISCNTADTYANDGGYIIAKLDNNFFNGVPAALEWFKIVWAESGPKDYHPWDVTSNGEVYYVSGEAHGYDWSAIYCLNSSGQRKVVENWRTHWLTGGTEWKGTPASSAPGGISAVNYSGIALKIGGRCELRSWTQNEFDAITPDGNGGTRKGTWPADFLFSGPCDPANPTANGGGYNGYSPESCCPVWGGSCIAVDKRNNWLYIGMNFKSYNNPANSPDFEPAVICMDSTGSMVWWSRLYHEITPAGDTVGSLPDQYVDALGIDYANNRIVVGARAHGNNTENLWEGNAIAANPGASGFQNQFTGTNGNIHESWLGKLSLSDGTLYNSTYVAELAEGTGSLGTAHPDPNLDGWPDPNTGWPDVNTTRLTKNNLKVTSSGDVCILSVGRRTITTANAYQKMVKPWHSGFSAWNSFVRVYDSNLRIPKYSSLAIGVWDTINQTGGDNTELFGVYKTAQGVVIAGRQKADGMGMPVGNNLPVTNVLPWGSSTPSGESALLIYYQAANLVNNGDSINFTSTDEPPFSDANTLIAYPNPTTGWIYFYSSDNSAWNPLSTFMLLDPAGRMIHKGAMPEPAIHLGSLSNGVYHLQISDGTRNCSQKVIIHHN